MGGAPLIVTVIAEAAFAAVGDFGRCVLGKRGLGSWGWGRRGKGGRMGRMCVCGCARVAWGSRAVTELVLLKFGQSGGLRQGDGLEGQDFPADVRGEAGHEAA